MARILREDILWAELNPTHRQKRAGLRPVLVSSRDVFNERLETVIAMVITSQPQMAGFPLTLELQNMGLPEQSWVKISQIRTLSVERMGKKIAHLPPEILDQIIEGLNEIVG